jgi:DegV family protein with EDD domain
MAKSSPKAPVALVTDSTADLPAELIRQHHIHVIAQNLIWEGKSYRDGIDIPTGEFYERLQTAREMPTTSQPSAGQFHEFFSQVAEGAESIVACLVSEKLSGTLASAYAARQMMGDYPLEIVDSKSASIGLGFITLAAARAIEAGASCEAAAEAARALVEQMRLIFVVDTLEFLHRGGRIGGAQRLLGSMLSMKPVLHLEDGQIEPLARIRTKGMAVEHMLGEAAEALGGKSGVHIGVLHAAADEEAELLAREARARFRPVELITSELATVIGANVGPGAVGLAFYSEEG